MLEEDHRDEGGARSCPIDWRSARETIEAENRRLAFGIEFARAEPDGTVTAETVTLETDILLPIPTAEKAAGRNRPLYGAIVDRERLTATATEVARILGDAYYTEPGYDPDTATDAGMERFREDDERELLWKTAREIHGAEKPRLLVIEDAVRRHAASEVPDGHTIRVTMLRAGGVTEVYAEYVDKAGEDAPAD